MNAGVLWRVLRRNSWHNWLVNYLTDREYAHIRDEEDMIGGRLIDIGCGSKPYEDFWRAHVSEHVGVDHLQTPHDLTRVDLVGSAYQIPVDDCSFDSAICNAVLEHLEEPELAIRECFRVLRPGGVAIYSVPFIWHVHEAPRDFFRYSRYGLDYLFRKSGFDILRIKALSGFWVTFGQLFVYNLARFNRGPLRWLGIIPAAGISIQALSFGLDQLDRTEQWTWMYLVMVRKPADEHPR
jgi:SAM-dependent methyltransferase